MGVRCTTVNGGPLVCFNEGGGPAGQPVLPELPGEVAPASEAGKGAVPPEGVTIADVTELKGCSGGGQFLPGLGRNALPPVHQTLFQGASHIGTSMVIYSAAKSALPDLEYRFDTPLAWTSMLAAYPISHAGNALYSSIRTGARFRPLHGMPQATFKFAGTMASTYLLLLMLPEGLDMVGRATGFDSLRKGGMANMGLMFGGMMLFPHVQNSASKFLAARLANGRLSALFSRGAAAGAAKVGGHALKAASWALSVLTIADFAMDEMDIRYAGTDGDASEVKLDQLTQKMGVEIYLQRKYGSDSLGSAAAAIAPRRFFYAGDDMAAEWIWTKAVDEEKAYWRTVAGVMTHDLLRQLDESKDGGVDWIRYERLVHNLLAGRVWDPATGQAGDNESLGQTKKHFELARAVMKRVDPSTEELMTRVTNNFSPDNKMKPGGWEKVAIEIALAELDQQVRDIDNELSAVKNSARYASCHMRLEQLQMQTSFTSDDIQELSDMQKLSAMYEVATRIKQEERQAYEEAAIKLKALSSKIA